MQARVLGAAQGSGVSARNGARELELSQIVPLLRDRTRPRRVLLTESYGITIKYTIYLMLF